MKSPLLALLAVLSTTAAFADDIGLKIRFGLNDKEATDWSGTVTVSPGSVTLIGGWRFAQQDKVDGITGWSCRTRPTALDNRRRSNNPQKQQPRNANAATALPMADNGVLISFTGVTEDSRVTVKTPAGEFAFAFSEAAPGKIIPIFSGAVEVERTAAGQTFTTDSKTDEDYPSGAIAADGTVWAAWQSYTPGLDRSVRARSFDQEPTDMKSLATAPGGDQLWLRPAAGEAIAITTPKRDIYKSAVAIDGAGLVWVAWAENSQYRAFPDNPMPNFDIFVRSFDPKTKKLSAPIPLSSSQESDVWPVAATDSDGHVWVAWQGAVDRVFRIFERHQTKDGWSAARQVSTQTRNCWAPAIAATKGRIAIAWDTYEKGDYDIWMREFTDRAGPMIAIRVAGPIEPERSERRPEIVLAGTGEYPDAAASITDNTREVVMRKIPGQFCFLASLAGFAARLESRHPDVVLTFAWPTCAREHGLERTARLHPFPLLENRQTDLPVAIEWNALVLDQRAPVLAPSRAAFFPSDPKRAVGVVGQGWSGFIVRRIGHGL